MFEKYYQQQLTALRKQASEFAQAHPSIAPLLSEMSTDPDVERLLEGTAFLSGILHQKIDDDIPEFIQGLTEILFPHLLRPVPAASILVFSPKDSLLDTLKVPTGTTVSSIPVDGTRCQFRTTMDTIIAPLQVADVTTSKLVTGEESLNVKLQLKSNMLSEWHDDQLTFYVGGDFAEAANMFRRFRTKLKQIKVTSGAQSFLLHPKNVSAPGFTLDTSILTSPSQSFRGYALLTEYFVFPEKFLFLKLDGLNKLSQFGNQTTFTIEFIFKAERDPITARKEYFTLFAVPIVNLFSYEAEPILVEHIQERYTVHPTGYKQAHYDIYSIDSVIGYEQGSVERKKYVPFTKFQGQQNVQTGAFQVHHGRSFVNGQHELAISINYDSVKQIKSEVLSVDLTCTNNHLAEKLHTSDISVPTSKSPELALFSNIMSPTPQIDVQFGKNELWRLISHISMNLLPNANAEVLKELLRLYSFEGQRADTKAAANMKRIDAVEQFTSEPIERIVKGILMRGVRLHLTINETNFSGNGDVYLFCSVLDSFLSLYTSMNTFTQLELYNLKTGEQLQWPPRIGEKSLL